MDYRKIQLERPTIKTLILWSKHWNQLTYQCLKNNCYPVLPYLTDIYYQSNYFKTHTILNTEITDDKFSTVNTAVEF